MSLNLTLCNSCQPNLLFKNNNLFKSKKNLTLEICNDLMELMNDENVDNNYIDRHVLNKIIQISKSEYGFIGKIKENKLYAKSITNIAWNASSEEFYHNNRQHNMVFDLNKTIFGCSIHEKKPYLINRYDNKRNILPKGHPKIKRFCGVPLIRKNKVLYFVGVCNKLKNYNKSDIKSIKQILNVFSLLISEK